jgi:hypothetical protein
MKLTASVVEGLDQGLGLVLLDHMGVAFIERRLSLLILFIIF